jgi:predicted nucleic acid-binding protein
MANQPKKIYWDTSCFLCLINQTEKERRSICVDILQHAKDGGILLYTSTYTIVEVIKPKIPNITLPKLTSEQLAKITAFLQHKYIKKVSLDEKVALKAVELARDYGLSIGDAIQAATAIVKELDELQAWDRDFSKTEHLIHAVEPTRITPQTDIEDFISE